MIIADIQRCCMHDGPGVRTTVFFKGCPLRCEWCHNPETQNKGRQILYYKNKCIYCQLCGSCENKAHDFSKGHELLRERCTACGECCDICPTNSLEIIGREYSAEELFMEISKDREFFGDIGGVTLSGGEPLMQFNETIELLKLCKASGINTAIETCGYFKEELLNEVVPLCDLFLWDVKDTVSERHKRYTGVANETIVNNLMIADSMGAPTRLRCIMIKTLNMDEEHYLGLANLYGKLQNCEGVELLPYHVYGDAKVSALSRDSFGKKEFIPTFDDMMCAKVYLTSCGVKVI